MNELTDMATEIADMLTEAGELLEDTLDQQWEMSRYGTTTNSGHGDPTGDTVVDPRRLALREARDDVLHFLEELGTARTHLREAMRRWAGDLTED